MNYVLAVFWDCIQIDILHPKRCQFCQISTVHKKRERSLKNGNFSIFEQNCQRPSFWNTTLFFWQLAFYWHLPTSGRLNAVKTAPQPLFVNGRFLPYAFHPLTPSQYLSSFSSTGQRVKSSIFHEIVCRFGKFFMSACCGLNFDAIDLPHSYSVQAV